VFFLSLTHSSVPSRVGLWFSISHQVLELKLVINLITNLEAAHGLAKEASRSSMDNVWIEEIPIWIFHIVNLELNALSLSS
jgi:hypothetical protein